MRLDLEYNPDEHKTYHVTTIYELGWILPPILCSESRQLREVARQVVRDCRVCQVRLRTKKISDCHALDIRKAHWTMDVY